MGSQYGEMTIEQLQTRLGRPADAFLKTVLIKGKDEIVAVVLPGDRNANEAKLRKLLDVAEIKFANEADFARVGGVAGFEGVGADGERSGCGPCGGGAIHRHLMPSLMPRVRVKIVYKGEPKWP